MAEAPKPGKSGGRKSACARRGAAPGWCHIGILRNRRRRPQARHHRRHVDRRAGRRLPAPPATRRRRRALRARPRPAARAVAARSVLSGGGLFSARGCGTADEALAGRTIESLPIPVRGGRHRNRDGSRRDLAAQRATGARAAGVLRAAPGLLEPQFVDGRWLFDGALVNPIPVSVCRAMGADIVMAISPQSI